MPMETRHALEHTTERLTEGLRVPMEMGSYTRRLGKQRTYYVAPSSLLRAGRAINLRRRASG